MISKNSIAGITLVVLIVTILVIIAFATNVLATEEEEFTWVDKSQVKLEVVKGTGCYVLNISGLNVNNYGNTGCKAFFANGAAPQITYQENGDPEGGEPILTSIGGTRIAMTEYFEKSGDVYITIIETQTVDYVTYESREVLTQKIERPALNVLGDRIRAYFLDDYTSMDIKDMMYSTHNEATISVKIGTITDKEILKAIRDKENGALSKLLNYAKNANSIYTGTMKNSLGGKQEAITKNLNLVDKGYYYVYSSVGGEYYPLEDVSLYQAYIINGKKNLYDHLSADFKWDIADDETTGGEQQEKPSKPTKNPEKPSDQIVNNKNNDKTEKVDNTTAGGKLPQTGESIMIYIAILASVVAVIVIGVQYKKYNIKY